MPAFTVPMKTIFPGDNPVILLAMRDPPFNPILNTVDNIYDDKAAVVNASQRGGIRGSVLPLLLDLARKPNFLHDSSVPTLDALAEPEPRTDGAAPVLHRPTSRRAPTWSSTCAVLRPAALDAQRGFGTAQRRNPVRRRSAGKTNRPYEERHAQRPISLHTASAGGNGRAVRGAARAGCDIVETAKADGHFTKLLEANKAAGTASLLTQPGPFTVFAPDDDAFAKVPAEKLQALMSPPMRTMLRVVLANHIVTGVLDKSAIEAALAKGDAAAAMAANNMPLVFKTEGGALTVNGAHIVKGPMKVDNGLVYVIDAVMLPASPLQAHY